MSDERRLTTTLPLAAVMAGTTFVAVTAFVLAYDGSAGAARDAGIDQAGWYPWCIEGVIVCASVATLRLRRRFYPWVVLLSFTAVSVAANVLHAWKQPGWQWWSLAFAAVPPLALPICVHLLLMVGRPTKEERNGSVQQRRVEAGGQARQQGMVDAGRDPRAAGAGRRAPALAQSEEGRAGAAELVGAVATDAGGSGPLEPESGPSALAPLALANGNGYGVTLKKRAEDEAKGYLERHGALPSENVLAGLAQCSRGTARNALAPLKKG